jgi:hypothetical protein
VRPFTIETDLPALHMQARAHAVAVSGRRLDRHLAGQRTAADAPERITEDVDLQRQLALVTHMREDVAAAPSGEPATRSGDSSRTAAVFAQTVRRC